MILAGILDVFDKVTVLEDFAKVLDKTEILDFNVDMDKKCVTVLLKSKELINKSELFAFSDNVCATYDLNNVEINLKYDGIRFSKKYYQELLFTLFRKFGGLRAFLNNSFAELKDNALIIRGINCGKEILIQNKCQDIIKAIILSELGLNVNVDFDTEEFDMDTYTEEKEARIKEIEKKAAAMAPRREPEVSLPPEAKTGLIYGTKITEETTLISDVKVGMGICVVEAEILDLESREIQKNGKLAFISANIDIGDSSWAISANLFGKYEKVRI